MDSIQIVTSVDKIRSYQAHCRELAQVIQPLMEEQLAESIAAKKPLFTTHKRMHDDHHFVFSIHAKALSAQSRIYKMIPSSEYFEAIFYDQDKGMYYLFEQHFFERYSQRMSITHHSHPDILLHYLKHNPVIVFEDQRKRLRKGHCNQIYAMTQQGLIHAELEDARVVVLHTFISSHMLTASQRRASKSLWFRLNKRSKALLG